MMQPFRLSRPNTLAELRTRVLAEPERRLIRAGGIDLIDRMKEHLDTPKELVELRAISGELGERMTSMQQRTSEGKMRIGALLTLAELAHIAGLDHIPAGYAAVWAAAASAATPGIRNTATLGGNLLQRPRCWYFRHHDLVCLKKGGDTCLAEAGENRYNAILGGGPSWIVHPSSLACALVAVGATVTLAADTERTLPIESLFVAPKQDPSREHVLTAGEVLVSVELPSLDDDMRSAYASAKEKQSHDWPLAEAATCLRVKDGKLHDVRVALGHVAPIPWRAKEAETVLEGRAPTAELFAHAAKAALAPAKPLRNNAYKIPLAQGLLRDALHRATGIPFPR